VGFASPPRGGFASSWMRATCVRLHGGDSNLLGHARKVPKPFHSAECLEELFPELRADEVLRSPS
jgi:hypothetical protein